jgi:hypothetical protein
MFPAPVKNAACCAIRIARSAVALGVGPIAVGSMAHAMERKNSTWSDVDAKHIPVCLAVLGVVILAGCGPRSDRLEVTGSVKLDGLALDQGSIRFTSTGTQKLFASGATIQNGEFIVPQEKGLPPGTYHVEVSSPDTSVPPVVYKNAPGEPALPPTAPERIPTEYSSESKHTIDVTADGDNHFDFDIHSRRSK